MQISESKLRKIIQTQLKEFRLPEKDLGLELSNGKLSPQQVGKALDNALGRTHVSGRKFHPAFLNSLNESKKAVDLTDDELLKRVHELSMMSRSGDLDHRKFEFSDGSKIQSPGFEIIKSILLFTGGHVPSVRNPEVFNLDKNKKISRSNLVPDKNDYVTANVIMTKLASAKKVIAFNDKIYRGIALDQNVAKSLEPGIEFNNWPISSFTTSAEIANRFMNIKNEQSEAGVFLIVDEPNFGCNIRHLSAYSVEDEYVLGKKLIIKSVDKPYERSLPKVYFVDCRIKE